MAGNVDTCKTASVAAKEELIMSLIGALVGYALSAFILVLLARMVLDWSVYWRTDLSGRAGPAS